MCSFTFLPAQLCNQRAEALPYYVVASGWERQEAVLGLTDCLGARGPQKSVKTKGRQVALTKTRMEPEDMPKDHGHHEDHLEGQAQCQMLGTSSPSINLEATSNSNQEVTS